MRTLILAIIGLTCLSISGCSGNGKVELFRQEITESRELEKAPRLDVQVENGNVTVRAWDKPSLKIRAIVRATSDTRALACKIFSQIKDDTLKVKIIWPEGGRLSDERCNITINLPFGNSARLEAKNGEINAQRLEGSLVIQGTNAEIDVAYHEGDVKIVNNDGNISCREIQGKLTVENSNGYVRTIGVQNDVKIATSNGWVELVCYPTFEGTIHMDCSDTAIRATVGRSQVGQFTLETTNEKCVWSLGSRGELIANPQKNKAVIVVGNKSKKSLLKTSNRRIKLTVL